MATEDVQPSSRSNYLVTHPRAISTAFSRVFLKRKDDTEVFIEPISDAYHWGPEKYTTRYANVEQLRKTFGVEDFTFRVCFDQLEDAKASGKRVFVKDMAKCMWPLPDCPRVPPSLDSEGLDLNDTSKVESSRNLKPNVPNPTIIPVDILARFHYSFLVRDPRRTIPSLFDASFGSKSEISGWYGFREADTGYKELRQVFDYLREVGLIGPGTDNPICLVDADELLAYPEEITEKYCTLIGVPYDPRSMTWDTPEDLEQAKWHFRKNPAFYENVVNSKGLIQRPRKEPDLEKETAKWIEKYGKEGAETIQKSIDFNMPHYLYLKQFAIKPAEST